MKELAFGVAVKNDEFDGGKIWLAVDEEPETIASALHAYAITCGVPERNRVSRCPQTGDCAAVELVVGDVRYMDGCVWNFALAPCDCADQLPLDRIREVYPTKFG